MHCKALAQGMDIERDSFRASFPPSIKDVKLNQ